MSTRVLRKPRFNVERTVRSVAQGLAAMAYEYLVRDPKFRALNVSQRRFVERQWPRYVEAARHTMAEMLTMQGNENLRESIYNALIEDAQKRAVLEIGGPTK